MISAEMKAVDNDIEPDSPMLSQKLLRALLSYAFNKAAANQ